MSYFQNFIIILLKITLHNAITVTFCCKTLKFYEKEKILFENRVVKFNNSPSNFYIFLGCVTTPDHFLRLSPHNLFDLILHFLLQFHKAWQWNWTGTVSQKFNIMVII